MCKVGGILETQHTYFLDLIWLVELVHSEELLLYSCITIVFQVWQLSKHKFDFFNQ